MKTKTKLTILSTLAVTALSAGFAFLPSTVTSYAEDAPAASVVAMDTKGAQVRTEGEDGIRFFATVNKATYDAAKTANAETRVGMLLLTKDKLGSSTLDHDMADVLDIPADKWYKEDAAATEYTYTGVLIGPEKEGEASVFPEEMYGKAIVARAYYYDGTSYTYSDETVTRSIAKVASTSIAEDDLEATEETKLQSYIDKALADATITLSGLTGDHINAGDTVKLTAENVTTYVQDGLVAKAWQVNQEGATVADGTVTTTQGANDLTVSVVYGSKTYSTTFDVYAEYTAKYTYENYKGEYVEMTEFAPTEKTYAKVESTVSIADQVSDPKYLREGGFALNEASSVVSTAVAAKGTVLTANFSQIALTEAGMLVDTNNGPWQLMTSYNSNTTNPVTIEKSTDVKDSGKNSSLAINWNGGYYTYLKFDTRNAITAHNEYNAIAFRMKNDAKGNRMLYLYSLQNNGKALSQAAPTGVVGRDWSYYVMPLDQSAIEQGEIALLVKFSTGYSAEHNGLTTGKTYFSDIKLINYESPENTLIDFGYSNTALHVSGNWSENIAAGSNHTAYYGSGIQDPVTGGSTFKMEDDTITPTTTGGIPTYRTGYGFFLGATGNNSNDADKYYQALSTVFADKGEATGVKIKMRIYGTGDGRGFDGCYIKPFDQTKDWLWCPAKSKDAGGTGKFSKQWSDIEFVMTELPAANNCRFYLTILGSWSGAGGPTKDDSVAMSGFYLSAVTYEYVTA